MTDYIKKRSRLEKVSLPVSISLRAPSEFRALSQWDVELRQIERGPLQANLSVLAGQNLTVIDLNFNKAVHQVGVSRPGRLTFGLPNAGSVSSWLGIVPSDTALMTFGHVNSFEGLSSNAFRGLTFDVDRTYAERLALNAGVDIGEVLHDCPRSKVLDAGSMHSVMQTKTRAHLALGGAPTTKPEEDDLILELLMMLSAAHEEWADVGQDNNKATTARRAVDLMNQSLEEPISISDICAHIDVSASTLRRAFLSIYGVSPKQFYLRSRLGEVRSRLLAKAPHESISDIANMFDFWHMGQFARDYRTFFGELPSQTLSKA